MQERSHAFAMKSQIWLVDPRPNVASIVKAVEDGFELSEASNTPVMLEVRIRACHVHGRFATTRQRPPRLSRLRQALENPVARHQPDRAAARLLPAREGKDRAALAGGGRVHPSARHNEMFSGDIDDVGIILQGGMYNAVIRALRELGLADVWGETRVPLYVMNVTYPLVDDEIVDFCREQEGGADRRGGPARLHRAGAAHDPAQRGHPHKAAREGPAADGRGIHRAGDARGDRRFHPALARRMRCRIPHARRTSTASRSTRGSARWPTSCRRGRRASAPAVRSGRSSPR